MVKTKTDTNNLTCEFSVAKIGGRRGDESFQQKMSCELDMKECMKFDARMELLIKDERVMHRSKRSGKAWPSPDRLQVLHVFSYMTGFKMGVTFSMGCA